MSDNKKDTDDLNLDDDWLDLSATGSAADSGATPESGSALDDDLLADLDSMFGGDEELSAPGGAEEVEDESFAIDLGGFDDDSPDVGMSAEGVSLDGLDLATDTESTFGDLGGDVPGTLDSADDMFAGGGFDDEMSDVEELGPDEGASDLSAFDLGDEEEPESDMVEAESEESWPTLDDAVAEPEAEPEAEFAEAESAAEPVSWSDDLFAQQEAEPAADDSMMTMEAVAGLAGAAAAAAASTQLIDDAPNMAAAPQANNNSDEVDVNPIYVIIALVVLLASFVMGGAGTWMAFNMSGDVQQLTHQVAELEARVSALQRRPGGGVAAAGNGGQMDLVAKQVTDMAARVKELGVIVEGPMSHLQETNEQTLSEITDRLDKLEKRVATGKPATLVKPLVQPKPTTAAAAPAATPATASGAWVVNVLSLTNEDAADKEMARVRGAGINAVKTPFENKGRTWYRLQVVGFGSYDEAKAYAAKIKGTAGITNPWVAKGKQ